jgi:hypothetical protein
MQIVVADTGPINYLVLIDAIDLLPKLFDQVLAPQAVFDELTDPDTPATVRAWVTCASRPMPWPVRREGPGRRMPERRLCPGRGLRGVLAALPCADGGTLDRYASDHGRRSDSGAGAAPDLDKHHPPRGVAVDSADHDPPRAGPAQSALS